MKRGVDHFNGQISEAELQASDDLMQGYVVHLKS